MYQGFSEVCKAIDDKFNPAHSEDVKELIATKWKEFTESGNLGEDSVIIANQTIVSRNGAHCHEFTITFHSIMNFKGVSRLTRETKIAWPVALTKREGIENPLNPLIQVVLDRPAIDPNDERPVLLVFRLIKMTRRLCMDIEFQADHVTWDKEDHEGYYKFTASNGYEVISRSRPAVETERMWLLGGKRHTENHSATKVCGTNEMRDHEYEQHLKAIHEWAAHNGGIAIQLDS